MLIKAIAEAAAPYLRAAQASREADELIETKGLAAVVARFKMENEKVDFAWFAPLLDVVVALKKRVAQLEARPPMTYREIWSPAVKYVPGDVVTSGNSMWYCKAESQGRRPGGEPSATLWRLCVRQGRDGKSCPNCTPSER